MPTPPPDRAARARELLAARARRASNLRRRVVAGALATFALAWGVIAFHGPMGVPASTATASTQTTSSAASTTSDGTASDTTTSDATGSGDAVVTAQS